MKKKILFVMFSLYNGGAEKSLVNLLNELNPDIYNIELLLFRKEGLFLNQVPNYVKIIDTPPVLKALYEKISLKNIKNYPLYVYKCIATFIARLNENNVAAQHAWRWKHWYKRVVPNQNEEYDAVLAYIQGVPTYFVLDKFPNAKRKLVWVHIDYQKAELPHKYDEPYFRQADGIVTISEKCTQALKEEFPKLESKIYCVENITSSSVVHRRADEFVPREYEGYETKILSIGRLSEQKGFDMAIWAASILKKWGLKFKWFVVGDGDLRDSLETLIKSENVQDCFELIGTRENPYPYIKNCTIFAQTSRFEGKSVVLDEAKIIGVPILATAYPTVGDQITNGYEGLIVGMSPEEIAEGIKKMLENDELRKSIGNYLLSHEYGNQDEICKYIKLIEG